ncbi:MAG: hypothetical protein V3T12_08685, partial [Acidiferrobacterales bacterium]
PNDVECCVVEIPNSKKGASVAVALNRQIDHKAVLEALKLRLPALALPRHFIVFEELPKMGSGKIDFRRTAALVRERIEAGKHKRAK